MTVHLIGKYETTKYTIEFKKEGEKIFADYYPGWQFQATYPVERRSLEVLSVTDVSSSLYDLVSRFLTQKYIPSISQETLVWAPPAPVHDTVVKVAQHLFLAEQSMKEKKYPEAITSLLDAQGLAAQVLDPFGEANFLEKLNREWVQELIDRTHDPRIAAIKKRFGSSSLRNLPPATCFIFSSKKKTELFYLFLHRN
jgi:hypothetical protein